MMPRRRRAGPCAAMDDRERLFGLIYEGVTNEEVWQELLTLLGDRLNAVGTGLGLQDMATHEFRAVADAGIDRGLNATYRRLAPGKPDLAGDRPRRSPDGRLDGDAQIRAGGLPA